MIWIIALSVVGGACTGWYQRRQGLNFWRSAFLGCIAYLGLGALILKILG